VKAIGAQLDARADLANFWGLFEHGDGKALAHQSECSGQTANATTCNKDRAMLGNSAHDSPVILNLEVQL
jgi:hypothetical protein